MSRESCQVWKRTCWFVAAVLGIACCTLLPFYIGAGRLLGRKLSEVYGLVNAKVFQQHGQHRQSFALTGKDPACQLNLLVSLINMAIQLFPRPAASRTTNVPVRLPHHLATL